MKTVTATELKAKCLSILDEVESTGEVVVVTKRGRKVAQISAAPSQTATYPQEALFGTVATVGDIVAPVLETDDWDAVRGDLV